MAHESDRRLQASPFLSAPFLAIVAMAFTLRLIYLLFFTHAINGEGAEYARLAQNLVQGNGYVGIAVEGRELMFPPLYPLLIAAGSYLTRDFYVAAQLVSFAAGIGLLFPLFSITRHLYGETAAYVAIAMAAVHPILIQLSATTWVEGLYITLIVTAIWFISGSHAQREARRWWLSGVALGLAYLTCPQAAVFPVLFLAAIYLLNRVAVTRRQAALFLGSFAVVALPYVVFLSITTGQVRIEGKTIVNNELGHLLLSGTPYGVAAYGVTPDLKPTGVWMRPNVELVGTGSPGYRTTLRLMLLGAVRNIKQVVLDIASNPIFGGPLILPLVAIGLLRSTWTSRRAAGELILVLTVAGSLLAMTTIIHTFVTRYYYILVPFLILWGANGIDEVARWARGTTVRLRMPAVVSPRLAAAAAAGIACLALVGVFAFGLFNMAASERGDGLLRDTGEWLAALPGDKTVFDTGTIAAFHASARYVPMPWSDSQTALKFARKKGVNFIVMKSWEADARPYLRAWFTAGVPAPDAKLVQTFGAESGRRVLIYQVDASSTAESRILRQP